MHISLVSGVVPVVLGVLTVGTLAGTAWRRRPGWIAAVARQLLCAAGAMGALHLALRGGGLIPYRFPRSFYVWCGLVVFAVLLARAGWRNATACRRMTSLAAVLCAAAFATSLINVHYDFYPTVGALFGPVSVDERTPQRLPELQAAVRTDGRLPKRGAVVPIDPPATVSGFSHRPGFAYLPPVWFATPRPVLPTILMVGGSPGLTSDWIRAGLADRTADEFAAAHDGRAPVLVFADHNGSGLADSECVDSPRGRSETYLAVDVRRWAVANLGVSHDPRQWAVAGLSEGGTCAVTLVLRHPDLFRTFANFSGDLAPTLGSERRTLDELFGGSAQARSDHDPLSLLHRSCYVGVAGWFEVGTNDTGPLAAARTLAPAAEAAGVDALLLIRPGRHNFGFWSDAFEHALPWLAGRLGVAPDPEGPQGTGPERSCCLDPPQSTMHQAASPTAAASRCTSVLTRS